MADCFSVEDLVDFTVIIARFQQSVELCRVLALGDRISGIFSYASVEYPLFFCCLSGSVWCFLLLALCG